MRFVISILIVWFVVAFFPEHPAAQNQGYGRIAHTGETVTEKVWLSRTCTDSKWYLEESDDQTATLECYLRTADSDDGN
jgi:hypothetical protein